MIRVAYVIHTFQTGGLERCVARLSSHIDRSRFQPAIICLSTSGNGVGWLEASDVPVFELKKKPGNDFGLVARFSRLLRAEKINLVHSHNWGSLIETTIARLLGSVPIHVHAERGLELSEIHMHRWRRWARDLTGSLALASTDAVVAVSHEIRDRIVASGIPPWKVYFIPNGIDPLPVSNTAYERNKIRLELGLDNSAILACSVCRLTPVKDITTIIDSITSLARVGRNIHLVLVGDGPERERLRNRSETANIAGRIHFVGEQADVGPWLAASDIYVNASRYEGMSQSILEAMASGLPIVVTDVGESAALVQKSSPCGRIVPCGNTEELAHAISELSVDTELRRQFGQRARQRQIEEYSLKPMILRYENLYTRLTEVREQGVARLAGRWRR
jgi:L-malate glycosyltransferase